MQQQPASTGIGTSQRPDDRIASIMQQQNPTSRTMGQQQQQQQQQPSGIGSASSGIPGSQDRSGMSTQQQQPTSLGGSSNAPQGSQDYSSTTTQQQPRTMGGASSTSTQGTQGGSAMQQQQQQQPVSMAMPGSGHKTHPTNPTSHGMHGHRQANLQGHVFSRLHRFSGLPPDLQQDTKEFEAFAEKHKEVVFSNTKHALIKTVYGVKGKELVDAIIQWLEARDAQPSQPMMPSTVTMSTAGGEPIRSGGGATSSTQNASTMGGTSTGQGASSVQQSPNVLPGTQVSQGSSGAQTTGLTGNNNNNNIGQTQHGLTGTHDNTRGGATGDHAHRGPMDTIRATAHGPRGANAPAQEEDAGKRGHHMPFSHGDAAHGRSSSSRSDHVHRAREIAEALVLSGFITPYKDDEKHSTHLKHYVTDHELFVPVGKNVAENQMTSVWSVVDGATYAAPLKHKAGLMGAIGDGKDVYVVFNEHNNVAYLFESDVARDVISQIHGETVNVQFESDHFPFGVLVESSLGDEKMKPELFNAESKRVQEEFVNAWLSIGAQYRENSIKRIVEADSMKSGAVGSGLASKRAGANTDQSTMTGQQEVRGADLAATGGTGAGGVGGSSAMNQSNIGNANKSGIGANNGIGGNDGMPTTTSAQREHHSKAKDALYGAGAAAGAGGALAHHDRQSADREGQFNDASYGANDPTNQNRGLHSGATDANRSFEPGYGGAAAAGATPSQHHSEHHLGRREDPIYEDAAYGEGVAGSKHHHDRHLGARDESSYNAPYGGEAATTTAGPQHHHLGRDEPTYDQGFGETGTQSTHHQDHHLLGRRDEGPNNSEAGYGGGAASSQGQGQNFGAQDSPSLATPYGGSATGTQSKHHHLGEGRHQDPTYDASYGGDSTTMGGSTHQHHHDQEEASPARNMADMAAAKIAGIEPTDQHSGTQGSTAPSSSKYQQEYPVGAHDTRTAP